MELYSLLALGTHYHVNVCSVTVIVVHIKFVWLIVSSVHQLWVPNAPAITLLLLVSAFRLSK